MFGTMRAMSVGGFKDSQAMQREKDAIRVMQGAALVASRLIEMQVSTMAFTPPAAQGRRGTWKEEENNEIAKDRARRSWPKAADLDKEFLSKFAPFSSHALNPYVRERTSNGTWVEETKKKSDEQDRSKADERHLQEEEARNLKKDRAEVAGETGGKEAASARSTEMERESKDEGEGRRKVSSPLDEHTVKEASVETVSSSKNQQLPHENVGTTKAAEARREAERQERRRSSHVPTGRIQRVSSFAGLGIGMALGTVGAIVNNAVRGRMGAAGGLKGAILSEGNSNRLTLALCRMRGAALKLGQLLSIQDEHVIPKESPLRQVIDRVREEAEQMPADQLLRMMEEEQEQEQEQEQEK
ncbi:hypothetical protein GUITHDRAFT_135474 [Guillardia theta CCMP2712]|uniref:Uncharacterized protein n=2 Tax=Guillardia theta TaxID=55529 RepID=L1JQH4_GUITC|nr:hypothetical protein GUITHDRAFT_135474 [Guillardia theta CCMP2712]EKX50328.1 hypothetical protein GUITHDRAFT_135474 [Guillardia theta CCMP2712]|eukprot:XP_005837308.1 hypothetical protein GUITHDRAFT_135474 [Guillardia theta CCMP2712]